MRGKSGKKIEKKENKKKWNKGKGGIKNSVKKEKGGKQKRVGNRKGWETEKGKSCSSQVSLAQESADSTTLLPSKPHEV